MLFKNHAPLILLASIFLFVGCASSNQVLNYNNAQVKSRSATISNKDMRRAIILAGTNSGWQMQEVKQGLVNATKFNTGHMAKVEITYNTKNFSINYVDSSNFQYDGTTIHKTYNKWVKVLYRNISKNLSRL
ncbi:hypothetical protein MNBD_GAMMA21-1708 [hydrothermal vent metagenome]|uniref:Lipoprotein n=1 Tax=hydrothermal vent metagenome TaxID=652676 RepID=A0A3B1AWI9_9ZZZZ